MDPLLATLLTAGALIAVGMLAALNLAMLRFSAETSRLVALIDDCQHTWHLSCTLQSITRMLEEMQAEIRSSVDELNRRLDRWEPLVSAWLPDPEEAEHIESAYRP